MSTETLLDVGRQWTAYDENTDDEWRCAFLEALGLDPLMTVAELQQLITIGGWVREHDHDPNALFTMQSAVQYRRGMTSTRWTSGTSCSHTAVGLPTPTDHQVALASRPPCLPCWCPTLLNTPHHYGPDCEDAGYSIPEFARVAAGVASTEAEGTS